MNRQADRILAATMAGPHFATATKVIHLEGAISSAIELLEAGWSRESVVTFLREIGTRTEPMPSFALAGARKNGDAK